jgi:hypothetical protein
MPTPPDSLPPEPTQDPTPLDAKRRAALAKLGRLAALTPPTILTLMLSQRASADSPVLGDPNPDP